VLGGTDDPLVSTDDLAKWKTKTEGPFQICLVPGGHFFVTEAAASTAASVVTALGSGRPTPGAAESNQPEPRRRHRHHIAQCQR